MFCDCNKPFKKYISFSNEISITIMLPTSITDLEMQSLIYSIDYKFLDAEFTQNGQIRIVQDGQMLSPINGYLHTIRVPAMHHIRLFGKSIQVLFLFKTQFFEIF